MNVLILGKNAINKEVEKIMANEGIIPMVLSEAAEIVKFKGQPGNYTVITPAGKYSFTSVLITEPLETQGIIVGSGLSVNLMNDEETGRLLKLKTEEKIIILLDYTEETPEYITARAIDLAKRLAEQKKEIVFLSKVVKSGYGDNELIYRETRNLGVTFIKYESLELFYDEEADRFKITAHDGVFDILFDTPYLISVTSKETPELITISKKLRLYNKMDGTINDDRFFLYPAFTSRRGIYYLNPALLMPNDRIVEPAMQSVIEDMATINKEGYLREIIRTCKTEGSPLQFPEVDPNKCAFCYSCYRACPHGALEPDIEASAMKVIESECEICGTCMAICPGEAITRPTTHEWSGNGNCKIYCCENGAAEAFEHALPSLGKYKEVIDSERVTCGGSVSTDKLTNDLKDYKILIIACCVEDACRHMEGDKRGCKQALRAAELLKKAGLKGRRIEVIKASPVMGVVMKDNILSIMEENIDCC